MTVSQRVIHLRTSETMRRSFQTIARACSGDWAVRLVFGLNARTNHEVIELPALCPQYLEMEDQGEWLVAMRAITAHEAFHVRLTSRKAMEPYMQRHPALPGSVVHFVGNALEDARIEKAGVNLWPGAYSWLVAHNELCWRRHKATGDKGADFLAGLVFLAVTGRDIQGQSDPEVIGLLQKCEPIIERARRAPTTEDCLEYASLICQLIEPHADWFPSPPPEETFNGGSADPDGRGEATNAGEGGRDPAARGRAERRKAFGNPDDCAGTSGGPVADETGEAGGPARLPAQTFAEDEEQAGADIDEASDDCPDVGEVLKAARAEAIALIHTADAAEKAAVAREGEDMLTAADQAKLASELGGQFVELPADDDPEKYEAIRREIRGAIRRLADALSPLLTQRRTDFYATERAGLVDPSRIWRMPAVGDARVFRQPGREAHVPDVAWYLLIDESGSMGGTTGSGRVKYEAAREAAVLFAEALKALKQQFTVVGFTETNAVEHRRYVRWGEQKLTRLATLAARRNNRDGFSIHVAARELLKRPEPVKVLFVLSDGQPAGSHPAGKTALQEAQEASRWASMRGLCVVGLYFGPDTELPKVRSIYPRLVHVKDLAQLPTMVARELKLAAKRAAG